MLGRRSFLIGCGGIAAAPVFAHRLLPRTRAVSPRSPPADPAALTALTGAVQADVVVLRIDGWDTPDDPGSADGGADAVWIRVDPSWRAAWR